MRENGMRSLTIMLVTTGVLTVAGCGAEPASPVPTGTGPPATAPSPSPALPTGTDPSPSAGGPPSSGPPPTQEGAPTTPPTAGELPGGLPYGQRRATGVVEKSGKCTLLRVGARHWELTGSLADGLDDGSTVTVTGQVTTATGGCTADVVRTLIVQAVSPG
jgi:hypothetical protein